MKLTFKITFLSDYHIGTGYGNARVDSTLFRDNNGFSTIRGTTLTGILRQSIWGLLQLDLLRHHRKCMQSNAASDVPYCSGDDMCPICRIMGTPAYSKRWHVSSARIDTSNPGCEKTISRNKVDMKTRTAEAEKLFSEEIGNRGTSFIFTLSNDSRSRHTMEEAAFIVAACRMIKSLGSSRTRGKGRCTVHLVDAEGDHTEEELLGIFESRWLRNRELNIPDSTTQQEFVGNHDGKTKSFTVVLLTEEPLLISNKGESGNRFYTNTYISGYTFLGALAWSVARRDDCDDNEKIYRKFIEYFRRGKLRVSPLYPALRIGSDIYPSIPSPLDLLNCELYPAFEEDGHGVKGFATCESEPANCEICAGNDVRSSMKSMNEFLALRDPPKHLEIVEVPLREEMHITIDPVKKNVVAGDLFGYMAIESDQYFIGTMEIEDWDDFINLLGIDNENPLFYLRIGKAVSRGYGRARIKLLPNENIEDLFVGQKLAERVKNLTAPIRMTLITDAIIIDDWGRFLNDIDEKMLKSLLDADVKVIGSYMKSKNVDGFNAHLGLPKWRDIAMCAGSTVGFSVSEACDSDALLKRLEELEKTGIGIRREEGFGKVIFNHPVYSENRGVSNSWIHLDQDMRTEEMINEIEKFDKYWEEVLRGLEEKDSKEKLAEDRFTDPQWIAVARWLRTMPSRNLKEFHNFEDDLKKMVDERQLHRDKKEYLKEKGEKGYLALNKVLQKLQKRLEGENENMREYLEMRAIEKLAEFIASNIREGSRD
jgi:CRISPR-associated protein Csx10